MWPVSRLFNVETISKQADKWLSWFSIIIIASLALIVTGMCENIDVDPHKVSMTLMQRPSSTPPWGPARAAMLLWYDVWSVTQFLEESLEISALVIITACLCG